MLLIMGQNVKLLKLEQSVMLSILEWNVMLLMLFMMLSEFHTADIGVECNVADVVYDVIII